VRQARGGQKLACLANSSFFSVSWISPARVRIVRCASWLRLPDARLIEPNRRPVIGITAIDYFSKTSVRSSEAVNV
jgi:hypothetical protein